MGQRFGVSRQTFYNLQAKFLAEGTVGLLAKRPGPKGPRKVTKEVSRFVTARLGSREAVSTPGLLAEIHATFGVVLHRRTLEKLVRDLRSKKTLAADAHTAGPSRLAADRAATHYERLRGRWMETATTEIGPTGERFVRWGLVGLLDAIPPPGDYVVEIHGTRRGQPSPALIRCSGTPRRRAENCSASGPLNAHAPAPTPEVTVELKVG